MNTGDGLDVQHVRDRHATLSRTKPKNRRAFSSCFTFRFAKSTAAHFTLLAFASVWMELFGVVIVGARKYPKGAIRVDPIGVTGSNPYRAPFLDRSSVHKRRRNLFS